MSFVISDLHDMIVLIEHHPEWKAELRRVLLGDDFLEIPVLVRQLVEANRRHDEQFKHIDHRFDRVEGDITVLKQDVSVLKQDVSVLKQDVSVLKQDVSVLKQDVSVLKQDVSVLKQDVGGLKGSDLERRIRERPHIYLGQFMRRARLVNDDVLFGMLDQAVQAGRITQAQADDAERIDAVVIGKPSAMFAAMNMADLYLVVEITHKANHNDVTRAIRRAATISAASQQAAHPIVASHAIAPALREKLQQAGGGWAEILPKTTDTI